MILEIAQLGQPVLREPTTEVTQDELASPTFRLLVIDMLETLEESGGVGLAAPQVFASKRMYLAAVLPNPADPEEPLVEVFINPRLTFPDAEKVVGWEGCLSFEELLVRVPRYPSVRVDYVGRNGQPQVLELEGFAARVVQHEQDHLEGVLILDHAASSREIIKASEIEDHENPAEAKRKPHRAKQVD